LGLGIRLARLGQGESLPLLPLVPLAPQMVVERDLGADNPLRGLCPLYALHRSIRLLPVSILVG